MIVCFKRKYVALLVITLAVLLHCKYAHIDSVIIGHIRGEATYRGRPTSYWIAEVHSFNEWVNEKPVWVFEIQNYLGLRTGAGPAILSPDPDAIPVYIEMASDEDVYIKGLAVQSLGITGVATEATTGLLLRGLESEDKKLQSEAALGLIRFGNHLDKAVPCIATLIKNSVNPSKRDILQRLKEAANHHNASRVATVPLLIEALENEDELVRWDAFVALKALDPESANKLKNPPPDPLPR